MNATLIESASTTREARLVATLVTAFAADPAVRWMYPDPHQYFNHFPDFVRALGGKAFAQNTADCIEDAHAAALWLPPGVQPDETALAETLQRSVQEKRLHEVVGVFEQMGQSHPETPHWYLPLIGVDSGGQGNGLGGALLRQGLARCDREGLPAYLEATNPRNVRFYERNGFKATGLIQTPTSPSIVPMLRLPQ